MNLWAFLWLELLAAGCLAGCAGETFAPDAAPEFLVTRPETPFYALGPQQAGPPDARLGVGERVSLVRREFGYSVARLADGRSGYVANEDLTPAPPAPRIAPRPVEPEPGPRRRAPRDPRERPVPVVEEPLPEPDLDAIPDDAPPG